MRTVEPVTGRAAGVGGDLRALRKARGLTLSDLALTVGRSIGWLSQVERGVTEPSMADLRRLADALEQPVSRFFGQPEAPPAERGFIVRADGRRRLGTLSDGLVIELLSPDLSGIFEILHAVIAPGAERTAVALPTEEAGYLVQGTLDIWIGERAFRLRPGDSFRFDNAPMRWRNPGAVSCLVIWVIAPPIY